MSEATPDSRVGSRFGPYQLRRLLGRGGMGEVYEAYDTVKDRVVALKLMTQEITADPVFRQRMQREANIAGRLQEPHVVPIHNYGEIDGQLFIDMRFVQGTDVTGVLRREGPLPPARAVAIIRQIASALDAAHRAGIVHRDVKPENILLTGDDFAYLVDFGIAAALTDQHLTKTGAAVGTWNYMAPERFGADEITYRADIYALACVLYECLTGTPPYPSDSLPALMSAHLTQPAPQPSLQYPSVPTAFDEVVARGMAKDPAARYPTTGELAQAAHEALSTTDRHRAAALLERTEQHAPLPTAPPPWPPWTPNPKRGNRKALLIFGAALTVIALIAGTAIWLASNGAESKPKHGPADATGTTAAPTTTTTKPLPLVAPTQLDALLLTPAAINNIMSTTNIQQLMAATKMDETPTNLSMPECNGAMLVATAANYASSGYTGVKFVVLQEIGADFQHAVNEAVVSFPSAEQALGFVTTSAAKWKACSGQTMTENDNGGSGAWTFEGLTGSPPKIAMAHILQATGWNCLHVLNAVSNVVIDDYACAFQISDEATRIADAIAANVAK
jgi:serine/threonine protein kinase